MKLRLTWMLWHQRWHGKDPALSGPETHLLVLRCRINPTLEVLSKFIAKIWEIVALKCNNTWYQVILGPSKSIRTSLPIRPENKLKMSKNFEMVALQGPQNYKLVALQRPKSAPKGLCSRFFRGAFGATYFDLFPH